MKAAWLSLVVSLLSNTVVTSLSATLVNGTAYIEANYSTRLLLGLLGRSTTYVYWGIILGLYALYGLMIKRGPWSSGVGRFSLNFVLAFFPASALLDAIGDTLVFTIRMNPFSPPIMIFLDASLFALVLAGGLTIASGRRSTPSASPPTYDSLHGQDSRRAQ